MSRGADLSFIETIDENKKSDKCSLILVTMGGDPDAAYKIGRYLQSKYDSLTVIVSGICKSAGTLLAISANELAFTPYGELGPLDVQTVKQDKLVGLESGLNISEAFSAIEERAKDTYHSLIGEILAASGGVISIHTATHAASEMVSALYGPIFGRIDPEDVGSRSRAMRIGEDYTKRLNQKWTNLQEARIGNLSRSYPSHSFVIDALEAKALFQRVRMVTEAEMDLVRSQEQLARLPISGPEPEFLYLEPESDDKSKEASKDVKSDDEGRTRIGRKRREYSSNARDTAAAS